MVIERFFETRDALTQALRQECEAALIAAVEDRGEATFMVSGGSTPEVLYKAMSESDLPWDSIYVALVDERWVEFEHARSNEAFVVRSLIQNKAVATNLVGMKNSADDALEGLDDCETAYQQLAQPFDVTILGMGPDGHTASWFPHAKGLQEALSTENLCAAVTAHQSAVTGDEVERMTLSLAGVLKSKKLYLLLTGNDKLETFRAAQAGTDVNEMPIRALLQQNDVDLTVFWAP
jgi:6-phosphogluconolactonase